MELIPNIFFGVVLGCLGGWLNAIAGGGGLILIPLLIFAGLPADIAIATNKFGTLGVILVAMYTFTRTGKTNWPFSILLSILALSGSYIGAQLLVSIDTKVLTTSVAILILALLPIILKDKKLGVESFKVSKARFAAGLLVFFLIQIYCGFFGGGAGLLIMYSMLFFFGMPLIEIRATDMLPWLLGTLMSLGVLAQANLVDYSLGAGLITGSLVGGRIGALAAINRGNAWVKKIFAVIVVVSAIKLLLT